MVKDMVSVIVPVYNAQNYLKECLDSIIDQSYFNYEVILVDNLSSDQSFSICNSYQSKNNKVRVVQCEQQGVSYARNKGLQVANGEFVSFVDADDAVELDFIETLVSLIRGYQADIAAVSYDYGETENESGNINVLSAQDAIKAVMKRKGPKGFVWNKLFKKNIIEDIGGFATDIICCEDTEFLIRYILNCQRFVFADYKKYHYKIRKSSATQKENIRIQGLLAAARIENEIKMSYPENLDDFYVWRAELLRWIAINSSYSIEQRQEIKEEKTKLLDYLEISKKLKLRYKFVIMVTIKYISVWEKWYLFKEWMRRKNEY